MALAEVNLTRARGASSGLKVKAEELSAQIDAEISMPDTGIDCAFVGLIIVRERPGMSRYFV